MTYEYRLVEVAGGDLSAARATGAQGWHVVGVAEHFPGSITLVMERAGAESHAMFAPGPLLQSAREALDPIC